MNLTRRDWLKLTGGAALAASLPRPAHATASDFSAPHDLQPFVREFEQPMFNLPGRIKSPVRIESVEMLQNGSDYFVRTRSTDGAVGLTGTKQVADFLSIFSHLVAPHFIGWMPATLSR